MDDFNVKEIVDHLTKKTNEFQERSIVDAIIKAYTGFYKDYSEYCDWACRYNESAREKNYSKVFNTSTYNFIYTPEIHIISEEIFNYAKSLNKEK